MAQFSTSKFANRQPPAALANSASKLLLAVGEATDAIGLLQEVFPSLAQSIGADGMAVMLGEKGAWRTISAWGPPRTPPGELLSAALDSNQPMRDAHWYVCPLLPSPASVELLVAHRISSTTGWDLDILETIGRWLAEALQQVRHRVRDQQHIDRLTALLEIARQWRQTEEMHVLLSRLAEAATKLLGAERASIFLWDRARHTLVGRPALGVGGDELRIPDDAGIV